MRGRSGNSRRYLLGNATNELNPRTETEDSTSKFYFIKFRLGISSPNVTDAAITWLIQLSRDWFNHHATDATITWLMQPSRDWYSDHVIDSHRVQVITSVYSRSHHKCFTKGHHKRSYSEVITSDPIQKSLRVILQRLQVFAVGVTSVPVPKLP